MKWIEILRNGNTALLQSESNTQYVIATCYDPTQPENQQWAHGNYFTYWKDEERKVKALSEALEYFRDITEKNYITRCRMEEIATQFKDCIAGDEDFQDIAEEMNYHEREFFEIEWIEEEE